MIALGTPVSVIISFSARLKLAVDSVERIYGTADFDLSRAYLGRRLPTGLNHGPGGLGGLGGLVGLGVVCSSLGRNDDSGWSVELAGSVGLDGLDGLVGMSEGRGGSVVLLVVTGGLVDGALEGRGGLVGGLVGGFGGLVGV